MVKNYTKNIIGSYCSTFDYPILVNSYGRSGSTVLTKSIINSAIKTQNEKVRDIVFRSISQSAWDLDNVELKNGIVYKTHDYPPRKEINSSARMLYTFADPVDVVLSLFRLFENRGEVWMKEHYDHLKVPYNNFKMIISEDNLHLERHLDAWLHEERCTVAFIRYETMWEHQDDISNFLGFDVHLPPKRDRKAKKDQPQELTDKLSVTYKALRNKVSRLDDFFVHQ